MLQRYYCLGNLCQLHLHRCFYGLYIAISLEYVRSPWFSVIGRGRSLTLGLNECAGLEPSALLADKQGNCPGTELFLEMGLTWMTGHQHLEWGCLSGNFESIKLPVRQLLRVNCFCSFLGNDPGLACEGLNVGTFTLQAWPFRLLATQSSCNLGPLDYAFQRSQNAMWLQHGRCHSQLAISVSYQEIALLCRAEVWLHFKRATHYVTLVCGLMHLKEHHRWQRGLVIVQFLESKQKPSSPFVIQTREWMNCNFI